MADFDPRIVLSYNLVYWMLADDINEHVEHNAEQNLMQQVYWHK